MHIWKELCSGLYFYVGMFVTRAIMCQNHLFMAEGQNRDRVIWAGTPYGVDRCMYPQHLFKRIPSYRRFFQYISTDPTHFLIIPISCPHYTNANLSMCHYANHSLHQEQLSSRPSGHCSLCVKVSSDWAKQHNHKAQYNMARTSSVPAKACKKNLGRLQDMPGDKLHLA